MTGIGGAALYGRLLESCKSQNKKKTICKYIFFFYNTHKLYLSE